MFNVLDEKCHPTKGSKYSACVDLYAREETIIQRGETKLVPLGVTIDLSPITFYDRSDEFLSSHYLQLMLRSSLGKKGLILPNGVGVIDLDYQDEIMMIAHNASASCEFMIGDQGDLFSKGELPLEGHGCSECYVIKKGDKIAQITLIEHKSCLFSVSTDKKREGGFGSTGA